MANIIVSVIVVTYNSLGVVNAAIEPLYGHPDIEIRIWDNASRDGTAQSLRLQFPNAHLTVSDENIGFAKAVNAASRGAEGRYILLLNPDARIDVQAVRGLAGLLDDDASVGIIAPLVEQPYGRLSVLEAGRAPTLKRVFLHWTGLSRFARGREFLEGLYLLPPDVSGSRDVDWVSGACLMVRAATWHSLGGMSERWFMYAEDTELCLRTKRSGWRVRLAPQIRATHLIGASSVLNADESAPVRSEWVTNLYELYVDEYGARSVAAGLWRLIFIAGLLSRSVAFRLRSDNGRDELVDWSRESTKFARYAADLLRHRPGHGDRSASARSATVAFPQGWGADRWARGDERPGLLPYGFDHLACPGLTTGLAEVPRRSVVSAMHALAGRKRPCNGDRWVIAWDEATGCRVAGDKRWRGRPAAAGVIWATDPVIGLRSRIRRAFMRRALRRMSALWCLVGTQVASVERFVGRGGPRVAHVPFGIDEHFFGFEKYRDGEIILSVGDDIDRDYPTLVKALEIVRRTRPRVRAILCTRSHGFPDWVEWHPNTPHRTLAELYRKAAVVAVATRPNLHVSGMTAALEAMATGRPVVATDTPGMSEYVPATAGVLVPPGDGDALAEAICRLLDDPDMAAAMGAAGRSHIEANHTVSTMMQSIRREIFDRSVPKAADERS